MLLRNTVNPAPRATRCEAVLLQFGPQFPWEWPEIMESGPSCNRTPLGSPEIALFSMKLWRSKFDTWGHGRVLGRRQTSSWRIFAENWMDLPRVRRNRSSKVACLPFEYKVVSSGKLARRSEESKICNSRYPWQTCSSSGSSRPQWKCSKWV